MFDAMCFETLPREPTVSYFRRAIIVFMYQFCRTHLTGRRSEIYLRFIWFRIDLVNSYTHYRFSKKKKLKKKQ